jgi:LuxR family maltose regulon positive regulatory protein
MTTKDILFTKLFIPPSRPNTVSRSRLTERLNNALQNRLALISAPAGFGKTTMLSEWADETGHSICWLSLDSADNDVVRFLSYFIAALQTLQPTLGDEALAVASKSPQDSLESALTLLVNDLSQLDEDLLLILDDYHLIQTPEIHHLMTFLLEHAPPRFHIVIATRADPPLPIARLRAQDQLTELRAQDLRFNEHETATFLSKMMEISLSQADVQTLATRTEGWIAGLQLAALSLQRSKDMQTAIEHFVGGHEYVADYLIDEVLSQQPDHYRDFLLQTSILERLTGSLCEAVTGQSESAQILSQLHKSNLFLESLDDRRKWYRYHNLFADLLRQRVGNLEPDLLPELHEKASQWYEDQGMLEQAIEHAFRAVAPARAAELVERVADRMMMCSEIMTLLRWMEQLPPTELQARPLLTLYQAGARLMSGYPLFDVKALIKGIPDDDVKSSLGAKSAIRALIAFFQGETRRSREYSLQALEELPENSLFMRSFAAMILGFAFTAVGDLEQSLNIFHQAVQIARQGDSPLISVISLSHIAELQIHQGNLEAARATYEHALSLSSDKSGKRLPIAGMPLIGLGEILREQNQLEEAYRYVQEGLSETKQWSLVSMIDGHLALARIYEAEGKSEEADAEMRVTRDRSLEFDATDLDDLMVAYHQACIWARRDEYALAKEWLSVQESNELIKREDEIQVQHFFIELQRLATHARLELAADQLEEALSLLTKLQMLAEEKGINRSIIEGYILQALVHAARRDDHRALEALGEALRLSEGSGFIRLFVDEGPPMARLLYQALDQGFSPEYTGKLLAAFKNGHPRRSSITEDLIEPLSERESEIMTLIAEGLSNQEIADQLVISLRTVKWHTSNIYSKLDVKNRTEATARARALGILRND